MIMCEIDRMVAVITRTKAEGVGRVRTQARQGRRPHGEPSSELVRGDFSDTCRREAERRAVLSEICRAV